MKSRNTRNISSERCTTSAPLTIRPWQVYEMAAVMQRAINIDDELYLKREDYISKLMDENHRLRDVLLITSEHFDNDRHSEDQTASLSSAPSQEQLPADYDSS